MGRGWNGAEMDAREAHIARTELSDEGSEDSFREIFSPRDQDPGGDMMRMRNIENTMPMRFQVKT